MQLSSTVGSFFWVGLLFSVLSANLMADSVLLKPVTFGKKTTVESEVKQQCHLPVELTKFIKKYAKKNDITIVSDNKTGKGKVLSVEIAQVASFGSAWTSGKKSIKVIGRLTHNGKTVGSFTASRGTGGGFLSGGKCSQLHRCLKAIGADIGGWLQSPSKNAKIGDDSLSY